MINPQRPVTAEAFRKFFEHKFNYLFSDRYHPGFAEHLGELNQMILFAKADKLTTARQFTGHELMDIEAGFLTLETTNFRGQAEDLWKEILGSMRKLGLAEELL